MNDHKVVQVDYSFRFAYPTAFLWSMIAIILAYIFYMISANE